MTVSLYTFVDLYSRVLATVDHLLTKGGQFAVANGGAEGDILDWRLAEDMHPLRFQVSVVCNFARSYTARAAGLETPADYSPELDLAGFRSAVAESRAWLAALTPAQFDGRDDVPTTVTLGNGLAPTLPLAQWLTVFATTNIYFHMSMVYAILRAKGVQIGKTDLFSTGL